MVEEWLRNPVTEAVARIVAERHDRLDAVSASDIYKPNNPQGTHDAACTIEAGRMEAARMLGYFHKETLLGEIEDSGQLQRD